MMLRRLVAMRASLTAASTASAPLLEKKNWSMLAGVTALSSSARCSVAGRHDDVHLAEDQLAGLRLDRLHHCGVAVARCW
jgi:hypothetical protein